MLGYWAAETRADGEFIGWFGLQPVTPTDDPMENWPEARGQTGVASLGYRLRRSAWGKGYATEGARALVRRRSPTSGCARSWPPPWR